MRMRNDGNVLSLQKPHWDEERPEEEDRNTHFWGRDTSVLLTKLQMSRQVNYSIGEVRKVWTYISISTVGDLGANDGRGGEAKTKAQVRKT